MVDDLPRTSEGMRIVDGMVELPRNPVDEKIDRLSEAAVNTLSGWGMDSRMVGGKPKIQGYSGITPWMRELLAEELVVHAGGETDEVGCQVTWAIEPTFAGWQAIERLRCGAYAQHKRLYEERAARDVGLLAQAAAMEAHPLYATF